MQPESPLVLARASRWVWLQVLVRVWLQVLVAASPRVSAAARSTVPRRRVLLEVV